MIYEISREGKKDVCDHADKMNQPVKANCLGDRWTRQSEAEQGFGLAASRGRRSEKTDKLKRASVLYHVKLLESFRPRSYPSPCFSDRLAQMRNRPRTYHYTLLYSWSLGWSVWEIGRYRLSVICRLAVHGITHVKIYSSATSVEG